MVSRVWLHEARGNESGWNAWLPDFQGFATHALSEEAVLLRLPAKVEEYLHWLQSHGLPQPPHPKSYRITERVTGDEIFFSEDRDPATDQEIATALRLLECSRSDLLVTLRQTPGPAYDWDPPYQDFAPWADWRTIRQILAHISNTETHYYLPAIGHRPTVPLATPADDWQHHLSVHRLEVAQFLEAIRLSNDRVRLRDVRDDQWSLRKVLRRLVRHELLHWKSIKRIVREFEQCEGQHP
jgi:predicted RNase H-like HicB family nuclease